MEPAFLVARAPSGPIAWLDGNDGSGLGRYSFLGLHPVETRLLSFNDPDPLSFFDHLEEDCLKALACIEMPASWPLQDLSPYRIPRWIGAIAYDLAWLMPSAFRLRASPRHFRFAPLAIFHRFESLLIFDAFDGSLWLFGASEPACRWLEAEVHALMKRTPQEAPISLELIECEARERHAQAIGFAFEQIRDGIVYEINLARRWRALARGPSLPRRLALVARTESPVPLGALIESDGLALISRSMERFLRWDRGQGFLEVRPIKGTLSSDLVAFERAAAILPTDPKEHAEHAMVVDVVRNDLALVSVPGSVRVRDAFRVEPYRHLHHLVSTVCSRARPDLRLRELIVALFPPASVTGAPKPSAIELIEQLEGFARGFYCGAIGAIDHGGGVDFSVAIRTFQVFPCEPETHEVVYFAGGGIVEASQV
ncbi:MAG: anthranilate synthase component I family protein, partial [Sandaracinaceae bacterium]|nr:anthranilate synthase component I family protein [Sandaracinaceae bacterium]